MKNRSVVIVFLFAIFSYSAFNAQNETQKWYFGNKAGLDFSTNPPGILNNGNLVAFEGCATMCDVNGNLLFYTNGTVVYNKNHSIMANGTGLLGDVSATQSSIIVKQPGSASKYYVFTQDDIGDPDGLRYSVVDMALAAGLGSVTVKNTQLYTPSSEKLTAVKHCNGADLWVITRDYNTNNFRTFLLTSAGVNPSPVLSNVGTVLTGSANTLGYMKASPNGRKLAVTVYDPSIFGAPFYLYDFDPATGIVSNPIALFTAITNYGMEFSPDGTKLYGAIYNGSELYQWDLCAGSATAIAASMYSITPPVGNLGSLQLAPNGKIYLARNNQQYMDVIHTPNLAGAACGYSYNSQSTAPNVMGLGLPNFVTSLFKPVPQPFTYTSSCLSAIFTQAAPQSTITGCNASNYSVTGVQWLFGDPASGAANSSTLSAPTHTFTNGGNYTVSLVYYYQCSSDTVKVPVTIFPPPILSVAGSFTICKGNRVVYTANGAMSYSWNTSGNISANTQTVSLTPTVLTTFTLTGTSASGCKATSVYTIAVDECLGIDAFSQQDAVRFFPNPFNNELTVEATQAVTLGIYRLTGELILEKTIEPGIHTLNTAGFSAGIYLVEAVSVESVYKRRLIKLH